MGTLVKFIQYNHRLISIDSIETELFNLSAQCKIYNIYK